MSESVHYPETLTLVKISKIAIRYLATRLLIFTVLNTDKCLLKLGVWALDILRSDSNLAGKVHVREFMLQLWLFRTRHEVTSCIRRLIQYTLRLYIPWHTRIDIIV